MTKKSKRIGGKPLYLENFEVTAEDIHPTLDYEQSELVRVEENHTPGMSMLKKKAPEAKVTTFFATSDPREDEFPQQVDDPEALTHDAAYLFVYGSGDTLQFMLQRLLVFSWCYATLPIAYVICYIQPSAPCSPSRSPPCSRSRGPAAGPRTTWTSRRRA